jgi:hypothetical protein
MTKLRVLIMCFLHLMDYSIKYRTLGGQDTSKKKVENIWVKI